MDRIKQIAEHVRRVQVEIQRLAAEGERPLRFAVGHRAGWTILVSRDPSKPGAFRATTFDGASEPFGHAEAPTFIDAIRTAYELGATIAPLS